MTDRYCYGIHDAHLVHCATLILPELQQPRPAPPACPSTWARLADETSSSRKFTYTTIPCNAQETPSDAHAAAAIYKTQDAAASVSYQNGRTGTTVTINLS